MAYFGNTSRYRSCLTVCKVLGTPTQISEKLELATEIMFGYRGNNKLADFYQDFSKIQQFYQVHANYQFFSHFVYIHRMWH